MNTNMSEIYCVALGHSYLVRVYRNNAQCISIEVALPLFIGPRLRKLISIGKTCVDDN